MHPFPHNPPLARTDSSASFSSEDDASMTSSVTVIGSTRRTRKRFSNVQLTMLENLFHQNSHPSREDRENVAKAGGMEIKSVTIWFQNKRQTERKTAASNNPNNISGGGHSPNVVPNITSILHTFSLHNTSHHSTSRTASPPFSATGSSRSAAAIASTTAMGAPRPTLDRVASRSELRSSAPRTPRRPAPGAPAAIWDSMPSSPLAPPISPPAREFIDFGKHKSTRRTLEWACAAARLADKDGYASGMSAGFGGAHGAAPVSQGAMSMGMAGESISSAASRDLRDRDGYRDGYRDSSYRDGYSQSRHGHSHADVAPGDVHGKGRTVHRQKSHIHISERSREDREREHEHERERERQRERDRDRERDRERDGYREHERERDAYHRPREYYAPQPSQSQSQSHPHSHSHSRSQERYRPSHPHPRSPTDDSMATDDEDRDEDPEHEAITPSSTWGKDDRRWTAAPAEGGGTNVNLMALGASAVNALGQTGSMGSVGGGGGGGRDSGASRRMSEGKMVVREGGRERDRDRERERERGRDGDRPLPKGVDDDDMFKAALALCGLGRRA